jgi:NOL1/NOP2/fmu family ribosome biogenesis protein
MRKMDEKELIGKDVKVFTEKTEFDEDTVGRWFRGKLIASVQIGSREFVILRWEGSTRRSA